MAALGLSFCWREGVKSALLAVLLVGCDAVSWLPHGDPPAPTDTTTDAVVTGDCPPDSTLDYANTGEGFIRTWCLSCHSATVTGASRQGAPAGVDFDTYDDVVQWLDRIEARATGENASMPPAGGVFEQDLVLFEEWVACGGPGESVPPAACDAPVFFNPTGAVEIRTQADADAFCASSNGIQGDLHVFGGGIELDCLCEVTGDLWVVPSNYDGESGTLDPDATDLSQPLSMVAPLLGWVGGDLVIHLNDDVSLVSAPLLETVEGDLTVSDNLVLGEVDFAALTTVGGDAVFEDSPALTAVPVAQLDSVSGDLIVARLTALTHLDVIRLRTVGGNLEFSDLPAIPEIETTQTIEEVVGTITLARLDGVARWVTPFSTSCALTA